MRPEEFWALTPAELWWQLEARHPKRYGSLDEDDMEELYQFSLDNGIFTEDQPVTRH